MPSKSNQNLYDILGIESRSDDVEIKKAYRKKVLECHPDKNPNNPKANELFHQITTAYTVLIDPESRKNYDDSDKICENNEKPNPPEQQNESGGSSNQHNKYDKNESYINPKFAGAHFNYTNTDFMNPASSYEKPTRPKGNQNMSKVEKSLFKMNVKRRINEQYDAEAANQHHSNRPISRKCQWTFLIVFLFLLLRWSVPLIYECFESTCCDSPHKCIRLS